ncbi:accessory gene regulator A [Lachnospiraceae bacterium]|nr:accessory gene regulator A [Lachnospiraceae bacterium]
MLKIAICDSESQYAQELGRCIGTWAANAGYNVKVKTFSHGDLLLSCLQEKGMFDLIFLDIEKDTGSGLQTAARIRERDFITSIVFVSWYDYYKEAYEAHPFYFLHKPANPAKVGEILDAYMKMRYQDIETFTFGINKAQYNLRLNDIMYFYSERRHVNAVCKDRQYTFYGKLGEVQRRLEEKTNRFLRIHQSFLVNMKFVKEYRYSELVMYTGEALYISKENRKKMRDIHSLLLE